jgi:CelD/BcsL family acetyltransferase involved in cellulose biosynthesis
MSAPKASGTTRVEVLDDLDALAAVIPAWEELARHAIEPNPLYEPWMLLPALNAQSNEDFISVLTWSEGTLTGLYPLARERRYKGMPVNVLRSWWHKSWMLCAPLVRAGAAHASVQALLEWLPKADCGASALAFHYLPTDGAFHGVLADVTCDSPVMVVETGSVTRALLRRERSAEEYLESAMSKGWRKELRRRERRLQERGAARVVSMRPDEDAAPWIADFLQLEASGWKGRQGTALGSTEANRRFAEETLAEAARRRRLQMVGIDFDGKPIARCCNLLAGKASYGYRVAYDEAFAYYSPGLMAEVEAIRDFHRLADVEWMDSMTDPNNALINRLWKHRRRLQSLLVGAGAWGELWVSTVPLLRWARRRMALGAKQSPGMGKASAGEQFVHEPVGHVVRSVEEVKRQPETVVGGKLGS